MGQDCWVSRLFGIKVCAPASEILQTSDFFLSPMAKFADIVRDLAAEVVSVLKDDGYDTSPA